MNQDKLTCTKVGHDNQHIQGICMNKFCSANQKMFCINCLQTIHTECEMNQFCQTQQFIQKLIDLKQKYQQSQEHKLILELAELTRKSQTFIKLLEQYGNNVIQNYGKIIQINQIDEILSKQELLSVNDWQQGYKLLTNQLVEIPLPPEKLIEQLHQMRKSIDQLMYIQSEEEDIRQYQDRHFPKPVKSDWNSITYSNPLIIDTKHYVWAIAQSPDGKYIASAAGVGDFSIKIWDPVTGMQVGNTLRGHCDCVRSINYSRCGKYIVSGSNDRTIRQWNVRVQSEFGASMKGHKQPVNFVQYTTNLRYIVSYSSDKSIRLWDPKSGKEYLDKRIKHKNIIMGLSLSPIYTDIVFGNPNGIINIWDYKSTRQIGSLLGHTRKINSIKHSIDGKFIISASEDQTIIIWAAESRQQIHTYINEAFREFSASLSPNMRYIISGGSTCGVRILDRITGEQISKANPFHGQRLGYLTQFSLDGNYIITGETDSQIKIMRTPVN